MLLSLWARNIGVFLNTFCPLMGRRGKKPQGGCERLPAGTSPSFHCTAPSAATCPAPMLSGNVRCPLSWFRKSKAFLLDTRGDAFWCLSENLFQMYVHNRGCMWGQVWPDSDKTLLSHFGVWRPNTPICQKRFVRGHKVSTALFALAFGSLTVLQGPLCKHCSVVSI